MPTLAHSCFLLFYQDTCSSIHTRNSIGSSLASSAYYALRIISWVICRSEPVERESNAARTIFLRTTKKLCPSSSAISNFILWDDRRFPKFQHELIVGNCHVQFSTDSAVNSLGGCPSASLEIFPSDFIGFRGATHGLTIPSLVILPKLSKCHTLELV